jgi:asparagine synthase (glutamine-hydrolysing)
MCGIALSTEGYSRVKEMLASMEHRGPDGTHFARMSNVFLGHNRLAIVEEANLEAEQPMLGANYMAAFNGEIFNYKDLQLGTEIQAVAKLAVEQNQDLPAVLNGYYAVVTYRSDRNQIVLHRDYFGVMPLFYVVDEHHVEVASEITAFSPCDTRNVKVVPANSKVVIQLGDGNHAKVLRHDSLLRMSQASYVETFQAMLRGIERCFNHSDRPVSVALSGGLDSSILLAAMKSMDLLPETIVTTFINDVGASDRSEVERARALVKSLGYADRHIVVPVDTSINVRKFLSTAPNPIRDFAALRHATVASACPSKVILCGEGLDELGLGYPLNREFPTPVERFNKKLSLLKSQAVMTLDRVNLAGMAYSKEYRVPFLDMNFVQHALGIDQVGKSVFRQFAKDLGVPDSIIGAPKYSTEETVGRAAAYR